MRINLINNVQPSKTNFGQLKLREDSNWDANYLQEFVHNKEVLKFVKYYHEKNIDVVADGHGQTGIALYGKDKNNEQKFFYGIYGTQENLKKFNAAEAITEIAKTTREKLESIPKIKEAEKFVEMFNTALKIYSDLTTDASECNENGFTHKLISSIKD